MFCKYRDIFGKPFEGVHSYRWGGVAVVDLILTVALAYVTYWITEIPVTIGLIFWIVIGMVLHRLFCVNTSVERWLSRG